MQTTKQKPKAPKLNPAQCQAIYDAALAAGIAAGNKSVPIAMVVGQAKSLFSEELDLSKPVEVIADGACGFAWVKITPANSSFANWAKKKNIGYKSAYGGWHIPVHEHRQSLTRKSDHAAAFAAVLREYGIEAWGDSRID